MFSIKAYQVNTVMVVPDWLTLPNQSLWCCLELPSTSRAAI